MNIDAVIRRAYLSLEDGDFDKANELFDQVLNEEPENALAYVGLLCAELKVKNERELANCPSPIEGLNNFKRAVRFGDDALAERLKGYNRAIINRINAESKENYYLDAIKQFTAVIKMREETEEQCLQKFEAISAAAERFRALGDYKDALAHVNKCESEAQTAKALSEKRKEEKLEARRKKKKGMRKKLKALIITVVIIGVGILGFMGFRWACDKLNTHYSRAAYTAFNNGDYEKAKKLYTKSVWFYVHTKYGASSASNSSYFIQRYEEQCERTKLTVEAFEHIYNGDYEKGNAIFDSQDVTIRDLPEKVVEEQLPRMLDKLDPVQVEMDMKSIYWVNQDGTVGRIGGNPIVDGWTNISKIRVNAMSDSGMDSYVAGLRSDGVLINTAYTSHSIRNVADFDIVLVPGYERDSYIDYPVIVAARTDGKATWYAGDYEPSPLSGLDQLAGWSDIKQIRARGDYAYISISDPDRMFPEEYAHINSGSMSVVEVIGETGDGSILSSAYNIKISYPSADEIARGIAGDITSNKGWGYVLDSLYGGYTLNSSGKSKARVDVSPAFTYNVFPGASDSLSMSTANNGFYSLIKGSDGKWGVKKHQ